MPPKRKTAASQAGPAKKKGTTRRPAAGTAQPQAPAQPPAAAGRRSRRTQKQSPEFTADQLDASLGSRRRLRAAKTPSNAAPAAVQAGTGAEDDQHNGGPKPEIAAVALADIEEQVEIDYQEQEATLKVRLQVFADPDSKSRLAYNAQFLLKEPQGDQQEEVEIGHIHTWRISRPTAANPRVRPVWQSELLTGRLNAKHANVYETALCLQGMYNEEGKANPIFKERIRQLEDNSLIFVQMVYLQPAYRNKGLIKRSMDIYQRLLGELPEWYAFSGCIVLVLGKPDKYAGDYADQSKEEVEVLLRGKYERLGWEVWAPRMYVNTGPGGGVEFMLMGRTIA